MELTSDSMAETTSVLSPPRDTFFFLAEINKASAVMLTGREIISSSTVDGLRLMRFLFDLKSDADRKRVIELAETLFSQQECRSVAAFGNA